MAIIKWTPFFPAWEGADEFFKEMPSFGSLANFVPAIDVYQTKDVVVVETPLPGINPAKVNISIENDVLTIEGSSEQKSEVEEKDYYRKEVRAGSFHRSVALPSSVKGEAAKATYQNGVLKIVIPKEERAKPKMVKIDVKK